MTALSTASRARKQHYETETMTLSVDSPVPVKVNGADLSQTDKFNYLRTIIRPVDGTEEDIHNRLGKARNVFKNMNNVWRSAQYGTNIKLKLYQSCVGSTTL